MTLKITHNLFLQMIFIAILIIAIVKVPVSTGDNGSLNVPRGGLPVFAKSIATDSVHSLNYITSNGTHIFCTSAGSNDVYIYTINGLFVNTFGSYGTGPGQFNFPAGIVYANGKLYIADEVNNRIEIFTTNGVFLSEFGSPGTGNGQFGSPNGLAIISNNLYVADINNARIQVFDLQGNFIRSFGSQGPAPDQFGYPSQIAFENGKVYITDYTVYKVKVWDTSGNFLFEFSDTGLGSNYLSQPFGIAASDNFIYVASFNLNTIYVFDLNGNFQCEYNGTGNGPGSFNQIESIMIQNSTLYGVDISGHQINEFVFLNTPRNLRAYTGIDSVSLVWQKPQYSEYIDINSYQIYRSTDGSTFNLFATSTSEYFTDNFVSPGTTYYYKITAVAKNGFVGVSDFSSMVKVTVPKITTSANGGFLRFDTSFMLIGILTITIVVRKQKRQKNNYK